jgi:hypothetical protein
MVLDAVPLVLAIHASALWAGAALHRRSPGVAILTSAVATAFLLQVVGSLSDDTSWLRLLSPYGLWTSGDPYGYATDGGYLVVSAAFVAVGLFVAAFTWNRKDLKG